MEIQTTKSLPKIMNISTNVLKHKIHPAKLNTLHLLKRNEIGNRWSHFNCWGFTSYLLGFRDNAKWIDDSEMLYYINNRTVEVERPKAGDIVVYTLENTGAYDYAGDLYHTGIALNDVYMIHKKGGLNISIALIKSPGYNRKMRITYRRVLTNK